MTTVTYALETVLANSSLNSTTANNQDFSSVAGLADGGFVAVYRSDGGAHDEPAVRFFNADGGVRAQC